MQPIDRAVGRQGLVAARSGRTVRFFDVSVPTAVREVASLELPEHLASKTSPLVWRDDGTLLVFGVNRWFAVQLDGDHARCEPAGHLVEAAVIYGAAAIGDDVYLSLQELQEGRTPVDGFYRASGGTVTRLGPETSSLVPRFAELHRHDRLVFGCKADRAAIVDVSDASHPTLVGSCELPQLMPASFAVTEAGELVAGGGTASKRVTVVDPRELGEAIGREGRGGRAPKLRYAKLAPVPVACAPDGRRVWVAGVAKKVLSVARVELDPTTAKALTVGEPVELTKDKDIVGTSAETCNVRWVGVVDGMLLVLASSGRFAHFPLPPS